MPSYTDLSGARFGKLTATIPGPRISGRTSWVCVCDCGQELLVKSNDLRRGRKRSCGHDSKRKRRESSVPGLPPNNNKSNRLYRIYNHMRMRCGLISGADERHLRDYRDRGITVCDEWRESFGSFRDWALANGYRDDLSIDRIDNDGGYSPNNCRWATVSQQNANKRHPRKK